MMGIRANPRVFETHAVARTTGSFAGEPWPVACKPYPVDNSIHPGREALRSRPPDDEQIMLEQKKRYR